MTQTKPLILISNDDGVEAPGIHYLINRMSKFGDVIAVAPSAPRSGQSSAITADAPLRIKHFESYEGAQLYSVSGTPVDCIKLAMHTIVPRKPDLMVCGINHGSNAGNCVLYSGTMGAVLEACTIGIPAVGFSLLDHARDADFSECGAYIDAISHKVLESGLPKGVCLNVNIPARCTPQGMKVARAASGYWTEEFAKYHTPTGEPFYWLTGRFVNNEPDDPTTDIYWLDKGYVSIVPVTLEQTALSSIPDIATLLK